MYAGAGAARPSSWPASSGDGASLAPRGGGAKVAAAARALTRGHTRGPLAIGSGASQAAFRNGRRGHGRGRGRGGLAQAAASRSTTGPGARIGRATQDHGGCVRGVAGGWKGRAGCQRKGTYVAARAPCSYGATVGRRIAGRGRVRGRACFLSHVRVANTARGVGRRLGDGPAAPRS